MTQITGFRKDNKGSYIEKDPDSELDYTIDWSDWLDSGDDIVASTWDLELITDDEAPLDEYQGSAYVSLTKKAVVYLSGGTAGFNYRVTNTVTTRANLTDQRYFRVFVKDRSL